MTGYPSALVWMALAAQAIAWPAVRLHQTTGGFTRLPPAERAIAEHLLRPQLGPLFQGEGASQLNDAIRSFRAERLNLGGTPALAVQPTGENLCGSGGNCSFWIIDLRQRRIVLHAEGVQQFGVEPGSKRGLPNIITRTHESATDGDLIRWRFTNGSYESADCATEDNADADGNPLSQPKITPHPCDPEGN
ncbi:MAG TPA: hypothetical protein VMD97_06795 [Candidatus Aquilonibacter sp.]|nr:hypothetical protein [Candidatus Aquilonibacter sp.]